MGVVIKGLKLMNANSYDKIIIRENNGNYTVDVKGSLLKIPTLSLSYQFLDSLPGTNSEDKIIYIIEEFLRYSAINCVTDHQYLSRYAGYFSVIKGNRELDLRLINKSKFQCIPSMVMNKYCNDRISFCDYNKDINQIDFYTKGEQTSYQKKDVNFGSYLEFYLITKNNKLPEFEKKFIKDFLNDRLNQIGETATIENKNMWSGHTEDYVNLGYFLTCGNLVVSIDNITLLPEFISVVDKYNKTLETEKKMQLKMEGF